MNPRSLRRLATDHAALHNSDLPPNYLFDPRVDPSSDLTQLDILLAGPPSTPYDQGVFRLHLAIPPTYPADPPKAFFRTKIFHPNVEPETGAVCVETLKRDWENKLTLRDVLVTISCLLVQPNASSALNAEAGGMLEQGGGSGWEGFERRARLMTKLQAVVPKDLKDAVKDAQTRGEEKVERDVQAEERKDSGLEEEERQAPPRRRRGVGRMRETMSMEDAISAKERKRTPSPRDASSRREVRAPPPRPFVVQSSIDDVFGSVRLPHPSLRSHQPQLGNESLDNADSEMLDANQENDALMSPVMAAKPFFQPTPARNGPSMPLGELRMSSPDPQYGSNDFDTTLEDDSMEAEYPPSPRKSPVKQRNTSSEHYGEHPPSPRKQQQRDCPASPRKQSPVKQQPPQFKTRGLFAQVEASDNVFAIPSAPSSRPNMFRAESSHTGANTRNLFFTPDNALHPALQSTSQATPSIAHTETDESEFEISFEVLRQSERKKKHLLSSPPKRKARSRVPEWTPIDSIRGGKGADDGILRFGSHGGVLARAGVVKRSPTTATPAPKSPVFAALAPVGVRKSVSPKAARVGKSKEEREKDRLERKLWKACGGDVDRWNRGDFGAALEIKKSRW